jgi:hypothetical protein
MATNDARIQLGISRLCFRADAADFPPDAEGACPGKSMLSGSDAISTKLEEVVDLIVGGEETLGLAEWAQTLSLCLTRRDLPVKLTNIVNQDELTNIVNQTEDKISLSVEQRTLFECCEK